MNYSDIKVGIIASEDIEIDRIELAARLGSDLKFADDIIKRYIDKFDQSVTYRYAFTVVDIDINKDFCDFGFAGVKSNSLCKVLEGSKKAILLALTTGIGTDRLLAKYSIKSKTDAYYLDAIASAAIESFADHIDKRICAGLNTTKRFSPGYADFPLEFQKSLLDRLNARQNLGIILSDNLLMIPIKSITAVIGIK